jgi:hypothetical protein
LVYLLFDMVSCLIGTGGAGLGLPSHHPSTR